MTRCSRVFDKMGEKLMAFDTPAVVLGAGINGLGVARSLASARVPVWLLDSDARRPEMHTRAASPLALSSMQSETLVEELVRVAAAQFSGLRPVLLLTQEESVKIVSEHRDRLSSLYRFSLPPMELVDALLHKQGFQHIAEKLDSPIPPLVHVRALADLPAIENLRYPVVIKPGERSAAYAKQFKKAYRIENAATGAELIRRILPVMDDIVVQEWIEGPDSSIYFCLQYLDGQGQVAASFSGRKIRSWPPQVGGTASCVAAPDVHDELSSLTTQFFQASGVIGMASMEYKRDSRTGEFRMVEPTVGRTDYQEEVATLNGVNLPHAAWCAELGLPFPASIARKRPVVWRVRSEDNQSAAAQDQPLKRGYPKGALVADALWRRDDPMPAVIQNLRRVSGALGRRASKMMGGSSAAGSES